VVSPPAKVSKARAARRCQRRLLWRSGVSLCNDAILRVCQCRRRARIHRQGIDRIASGNEAAPDLPHEEKQQARRHLAALPDGNALCHGDLHPGNVLLTERGPVIIDCSAATRGEAVGCRPHHVSLSERRFADIDAWTHSAPLRGLAHRPAAVPSESVFQSATGLAARG